MTQFLQTTAARFSDYYNTRMKERNLHEPIIPPWRDTVAGGAGGICVVLAGQPLDTVKVRLQTTTENIGAWKFTLRTFRKEGIVSLYKGIASPMWTTTPIFALSFATYGWAKLMLQDSGREHLSLTKVAIAGGFSGATTTVITAPAELIKCRLQMAQDPRSRPIDNSFDCARQVWKEGGFRGFYRGTVATLWRDVPGSAAWFGVYEAVKRMPLSQSNPSGSEPGFLQIMVAGGLGGVSHWIVCLPFDNLKTKIQTARIGTYTGTMDCFRKTIRREGFSSLYSGFTPVFIRAFPANAVAFLGFEFTMRLLNYFVPPSI